LAQFDAHRTIPGDVAAIREFWAPTRYNLYHFPETATRVA